jgi:hypothetical protein
MQRLPVTIEDTLVAWVQATLPDATPIWANQDGERPALPFVLLDVITGPQSVGPAEERYKSDDTFTYGIRKRGTLNVQVFGDDALVRAGDLVTALELPSRQAILQAAGIAVWGADGPRDISQFLDTAYEPRANLDLFISWPQPVEDSPGEIRKVQVAGAVDSITIDRTMDIES